MRREQRFKHKPRRTKAPATSTLAFDIESLDALGQGVCKINGTPTFIKKTLPGERGTATVYQRKKGVQFARLQTLDQPSPARIEAACPHYTQCPGCDYLHTDYASELSYKEAALRHHLNTLLSPTTSISVIGAPQRLAYRNRIQLHARGKRLGFIDALDDTLVEVPDCQLIRPELRPHLQALYATEKMPPAAMQRRRGKAHCELYLRDGEVDIHWNQDYAAGGFTQVNAEMNQQLQEQLLRQCQPHAHAHVLDLFSGQGNLSQVLCDANNSSTIQQRIMVDNQDWAHADFFKLDLSDPQAAQRLARRCPQKSFDLIIADPPRQGFAHLNLWLRQYQPRQLLYVSCYPATLARDLSQLEQPFNLSAVVLLDMFPATRHFETLVSIEFKRR